jgi:LysM repeat protein
MGKHGIRVVLGLLLSIGMLLSWTMGTPVFATTTTPSATSTPEPVIHVVRSGDSLLQIARTYGVTTQALLQANNLSDPNRIIVGQRLIVPVSATATATAIPSTLKPTITATTAGALDATPVPEQRTDVVLPGDSLARVASRNGTTVQNLINLNNLANPDLIVVGQRLIVADGSTPVPPTTESGTAPASIGFGLGVSVYLSGQDIIVLTDQVRSLGLDWVKVEVSWEQVEPQQGTFDFALLDQAVTRFSGIRNKILFTITRTPSWARTYGLEDGPPDDFKLFGDFVAALAGRYAGRVTAYQIWNEPNLRRNWASDVHRIDASNYMLLLQTAYAKIKEADPAALVITAGLAPTGFNDGVNALNDRLYLQSMYDTGLRDFSDGVAVHASGFGNPPTADCCLAPDGVLSHFENRSFYFKSTLEDYRAIMDANQDDRLLWVSSFGWGTSEDLAAPRPDLVYVSYNSMIEQANYILSAFEMGRASGRIGPMFLNNLNGCQAADAAGESCYFALIGSDGLPRLAYNTLSVRPR